MKEYIVSLKVEFETPLGVFAKNKTEAKRIAKLNFKKTFNKFSEKLNDVAELNIDVDYVECDDYD